MKHNIFKKPQFLLLLSVFLLGITFTEFCSAATLISSVNREQMNEDETLNLTITLDDASFSGNPDLAGLATNFDILNSTSSSSTTIINGAYSSKKEWRYTLLPKKTGKLLIPSFKLKNAFSDAIEIDVLTKGANTNNKSKPGNNESSDAGDLFIEQSIDKSEAYVQERMTLTLRLFTAVRIDRPDIQAPVLPDFMVEKLTQAEYQSNRNGKTYYVLEYKYGLFPNKSGKVTLPRQRYQINEIVSDRQSPFSFPGFDQQNTQPRFLFSPELILNIKSQPDNLPSPYWLASEDVVISDNWPADQSVDVGTPLTRSIEIKAVGNLAAHIPPLPAETINGLKSYSEQPELNNSHTADNFLATRKENIAIVPVQAGTYTLPAIHIHWWDTKNKQFRISTLSERKLNVKGSVAANSSTPPQLQNSTPVQPSPDISSLVSPASPAQEASTALYANVFVWMGVAAFFAALWLVTLVVMMSRKRRISSTTLSSTEAAQEQSLKDAFKKLKAACAANNARKTREAIIQWAQQQWPHAGISTLQQLKVQLNNDQFNKIADELDAALYRESATWSGEKLLDLLQSQQFKIGSQQKTSALPGLYS